LHIWRGLSYRVYLFDIACFDIALHWYIDSFDNHGPGLSYRVILCFDSENLRFPLILCFDFSKKIQQ
jgi:hypothetical protein